MLLCYYYYDDDDDDDDYYYYENNNDKYIENGGQSYKTELIFVISAMNLAGNSI